MLTIRVNGIHGDQTVLQAAYVVRGTNQESGRERIEFYNDAHDQTHTAVEYGNVYVMNDSGKTVAAFDLGGWEHAEEAKFKAA